MSARFRITDGTDYVDLLGGPIYIADWKPTEPAYKSGGTRRSISMADGSRLIDTSYDDIVETMTIKIKGGSQDKAIEVLHKLEDLLVKATEYWTETEQDTPVYIEARASQETNTRYALIHTGRLEGINNPFDSPFLQVDCSAVFDDITLQLERFHWQDVPPGTANCVQISNSHVWEYSDWAVDYSTPSGIVYVLFECSDGTLLAGDSAGAVYRSTDGGGSWAAASVGPASASDVWAFAEDSYGNVYAACDNGIFRSTDSGDNWTLRTNARNASTVNCLVWSDFAQALYLVDHGDGLYYSQDGGSSWTNVGSAGTITTDHNTVHLVDVNRTDMQIILLGHDGSHGGSSHMLQGFVYSGSPEPVSWNVVYDNADSAVVSFFEPGDGYVYAGVTGELYRCLISSSNMIYWSRAASGFGATLYGFDIDDDGICYVTGNAVIWVSTNMLTWSRQSAAAATQFYSVLYSSESGNIFAGEDGDIWILGKLPPVGQIDAACGAFVANRHTQSNITHAFVYDASAATYTSIYPQSTFPVNLLPATPAADDMLYIGISTSGGVAWPSFNVVFDIGTGAHGIAGVWQYYTSAGSTWNNMDNYVDYTNELTIPGTGSLSWEPDDNTAWATTTVNGVTGYWIRYKVTSVSSPVTPTQDNRNIYTVCWPYIQTDELGGNLPACCAIEVACRGDKNGPTSTTEPNNWANFLAVGSRSLSRGEDFTPYLNASYDNQNMTGIDVQLGLSASYYSTSTTRYPARYLVVVEPTAAEPMVPRVSWVLSGGLGIQWKGHYHAFVRCYESSTNDTPQWSIRLRTTVGSSGLEDVTVAKKCPFRGLPTANRSFCLLDLGPINISAPQMLKADEAGQTVSIILEASCDSGDNDLYIMDVVLLPTDEWAGMFFDHIHNTTTPLRYGIKLLIDSVFHPKVPLRSITLTDNSDGYVNSVWAPDSNGQVSLKKNAAQRLWFLSGRYAEYVLTDNSGVNNKDYFSMSPFEPVEMGIAVGQTVWNLTDGSLGTITNITGTKVYANLRGGTDNDFDNGDACLFIRDFLVSSPHDLFYVKLWAAQRYLTMRGDS